MGIVNLTGQNITPVNINGNPIIPVNLTGQNLSNADESTDYNEYNSDYQKAILDARNEWQEYYRQDTENIIPYVLTTDQHLNFNTTAGKQLYEYLAKAIKWNEVSASINLGDVCGSHYVASDLDNMVSAFSRIPKSKQINVEGNHDNQGLCDDDSAMDLAFDTYFNNSEYNGSVRFNHRGFEYMIDEQHKTKYVCMGSWDYSDGVYYHYRISPDSLSWLISVLEQVDEYDIVILSHIQPYALANANHYPQVDGNSYTATWKADTGTSCVGYNVGMDQMFLARKNKTSGSITDADGNVHEYDFSGCTSDILCSLHGHSHVDWYSYTSGKVPAIIYDAYRYDAQPFYFGLIDKTNRCIKSWKVDNTNLIQTITIPFDEHLIMYNGISLPNEETEISIHVGETYNLHPIVSTEEENDGTFPTWNPTYSVRIGSTLSSAIAKCENGVVTGVSVGQCYVYAMIGSYSARCVVNVV